MKLSTPHKVLTVAEAVKDLLKNERLVQSANIHDLCGRCQTWGPKEILLDNAETEREFWWGTRATHQLETISQVFGEPAEPDPTPIADQLSNFASRSSLSPFKLTSYVCSGTEVGREEWLRIQEAISSRDFFLGYHRAGPTEIITSSQPERGEPCNFVIDDNQYTDPQVRHFVFRCPASFTDFEK